MGGGGSFLTSDLVALSHDEGRDAGGGDGGAHGVPVQERRELNHWVVDYMYKLSCSTVMVTSVKTYSSPENVRSKQAKL